MSDVGHNSGNVTAERLRSIVERYERIDDEVKGLRSDQKDIMTEAASAGYDRKVLKQLVNLRKRDPKEAADDEALLEVYKAAMGM